MDYGRILKRTWQLVWSYRALWILGALLALTTTNGFFLAGDWDQEEENLRGIAVKINQDSTIYLPGEGLTVDFTDPHGIRVWFDDNGTQREWRELRDLFAEVVPRDVRAVLIAFGIVLAGVILVGTVVRYTAEAGLIRAVNHTEETGEKVSVWQSLRLGFSRTAWRVFLIDVAIRLPVTLVLLLLFGLTLAPLGLWASGSTLAGALGTALTTGLLFLWVLLLMTVEVVLSPLVQVARRACGVEGLGVRTSIRQSLVTVRSHVGQVGLVWLIWIGIRLLWMLATIPVLIVLSPILLLSVLGGALVGAVPALVVGGLLTPVLAGPFPWIVGAIAALPLFALVAIAPMLLVGGLVEVAKSGLWTLAYRELLALEGATAAQRSEPGVSRLEQAPASS